jgi:hypothetical protein
MPLAVMQRLDLTETGFGLDTEMTALLLRRGVRPFEVPVRYYSRTHAQGKKINWRDAVVCLRILLRERMARRGDETDVVAVASSPAIFGADLNGHEFATSLPAGNGTSLPAGNASSLPAGNDGDGLGDELATATP